MCLSSKNIQQIKIRGRRLVSGPRWRGLSLRTQHWGLAIVRGTYCVVWHMTLCFLAGCTDGLACTYYSVAYVRLSSVIVCCNVIAYIVATEKVTIDSIIESHTWEIDWYQNEWPWPLFRGRLRSRRLLCHIRHWISHKPLKIEAWFRKTSNRKWPTWNQMVTWPMTSCDLKSQTRLEPIKTPGGAI